MKCCFCCTASTFSGPSSRFEHSRDLAATHTTFQADRHEFAGSAGDFMDLTARPAVFVATAPLLAEFQANF
jgi:hypothetical protein